MDANVVDLTGDDETRPDGPVVGIEFSADLVDLVASDEEDNTFAERIQKEAEAYFPSPKKSRPPTKSQLAKSPLPPKTKPAPIVRNSNDRRREVAAERSAKNIPQERHSRGVKRSLGGEGGLRRTHFPNTTSREGGWNNGNWNKARFQHGGKGQRDRFQQQRYPGRGESNSQFHESLTAVRDPYRQNSHSQRHSPEFYPPPDGKGYCSDFHPSGDQQSRNGGTRWTRNRPQEPWRAERNAKVHDHRSNSSPRGSRRNRDSKTTNSSGNAHGETLGKRSRYSGHYHDRPKKNGRQHDYVMYQPEKANVATKSKSRKKRKRERKQQKVGTTQTPDSVASKRLSDSRPQRDSKKIGGECTKVTKSDYRLDSNSDSISPQGSSLVEEIGQRYKPSEEVIVSVANVAQEGKFVRATLDLQLNRELLDDVVTGVHDCTKASEPPGEPRREHERVIPERKPTNRPSPEENRAPQYNETSMSHNDPISKYLGDEVGKPISIAVKTQQTEASYTSICTASTVSKPNSSHPVSYSGAGSNSAVVDDLVGNDKACRVTGPSCIHRQPASEEQCRLTVNKQDDCNDNAASKSIQLERPVPKPHPAEKCTKNAMKEDQPGSASAISSTHVKADTKIAWDPQSFFSGEGGMTADFFDLVDAEEDTYVPQPFLFQGSPSLRPAFLRPLPGEAPSEVTDIKTTKIIDLSTSSLQAIDTEKASKSDVQSAFERKKLLCNDACERGKDTDGASVPVVAPVRLGREEKCEQKMYSHDQKLESETNQSRGNAEGRDENFKTNQLQEIFVAKGHVKCDVDTCQSPERDSTGVNVQRMELLEVSSITREDSSLDSKEKSSLDISKGNGTGKQLAKVTEFSQSTDVSRAEEPAGTTILRTEPPEVVTYLQKKDEPHVPTVQFARASIMSTVLSNAPTNDVDGKSKGEDLSQVVSNSNSKGRVSFDKVKTVTCYSSSTFASHREGADTVAEKVDLSADDAAKDLDAPKLGPGSLPVGCEGKEYRKESIKGLVLPMKGNKILQERPAFRPRKKAKGSVERAADSMKNAEKKSSNPGVEHSSLPHKPAVAEKPNFIIIDDPDDNGGCNVTRPTLLRNPSGGKGPTAEPRPAHSFSNRRRYKSPWPTYFEKNFNFFCSKETAMEEQERLFREAAARARNHVRSHVESGDKCRPHEISEPIFDISQRYPDHWQWEDPSTCLGLPRDASLRLVKSQYRRLAKLYHPDKSGVTNTSAKFHAVASAYRNLCDRIHQVR